MKICGLTRREDAVSAAEAGADFLGVVLSEGFGRSVSVREAESILDGLDVDRVAVLVDENPDVCVRAGRAIGASVLQLHGSERVEDIMEVRDRGAWTLWKAIRARSVQTVVEAVSRYGDVVDGFLIEGWREGATGGAGLHLKLDPDEIRTVLAGDRTFILAGGLTPETVEGAAARFGPDVVDVSSGVERDVGVKDRARILSFVRRAHASVPSDDPGTASGPSR